MGIDIGTALHSIWSFVKLEKYWERILDDINEITRVKLQLDTRFILLAHDSVLGMDMIGTQG